MAEGERHWVCNTVGILVGICALNWGLVGIAQIDVISRLLGEMTLAARVVYILIGVAGLLKLVALIKHCPCQRSSTPKQ